MSTASDDSLPQDRVVMPPASTTHFDGARRLRIAAEVWGQPHDPVVLFLHGIGQTRHAWATAAARIASRGWRCIAVDLRGHGDSSWDPDGDYSLKALADDCTAIIEQLGSPPVLVGASLGGMIVLYAEGMSARTFGSGLILVDVSLAANHDATERIREFMLSGFDGFDSLDAAARAISAYRQSPRSKSGAQSGLRRVLREREGRWYWHWDPAVVQQFTRSTDTGRMGELRRAPLRQIHIPTLALRGGRSDVVTDGGISELLRIVPGAEVLEIPGASHMIAGDQNDAFEAAVVAFLEARVRPRTIT